MVLFMMDEDSSHNHVASIFQIPKGADNQDGAPYDQHPLKFVVSLHHANDTPELPQ